MAAKKSATKKILKCNQAQGIWCEAMDQVLQGEFQVKGLALLGIHSRKSSGLKGTIVVYKKKPSDPGIVLNCCPWCGAKIGHYKVPA